MHPLNEQFEQRRRLLKGFAAAGLVGGLSAILPGTALLAAPNTEEQAYRLGMAAYVYGYPLIYFARLRYKRMMEGDAMTGEKHRYGAFVHRRQTISPAIGGMPQTDTLYSNLWADLRNEPLLVTIPAIAARYWSLQLCDLFGVTFGVPNHRELPATGSVIALVGPDWNGTLPSDVTKVYRAAAPQVFAVLRLYFANDDDREVVIGLQDQFQLRPLSAYGKADWQAPTAQAFQPLDTAADPLADFKALQQMFSECPPPHSDATLLATFAPIGLGGNALDFSTLDDPTRQGLMRAETDARALVMGTTKSMAGNRSSNGWLYPLAHIGTYGDDYLYRASMALLGTVALPTTETIYLLYQKDETGQLLDGNAQYTVHFAAGDLPQAAAFWSIHLYRYEGYSVIPNAINRYSVGNRSQLQHGADGSVTLYLQANDPGGDKSANWLPTQAGKPFLMILRGYEPTGSFAALTWPGPAVQRL